MLAGRRKLGFPMFFAKSFIFFFKTQLFCLQLQLFLNIQFVNNVHYYSLEDFLKFNKLGINIYKKPVVHFSSSANEFYHMLIAEALTVR